MTPETTNEFLVCPSHHIMPKEVTQESLTLSVIAQRSALELLILPVMNPGMK